MGILANHVPSVEALKAGVVEVIEDAGSQSKKWFSKSRLLGVVEAGIGQKEHCWNVGGTRTRAKPWRIAMRIYLAWLASPRRWSYTLQALLDGGRPS